VNNIISQLLMVLVPVVAGFFATEIGKGAAWINALPAPLPQLIGVAVAFVLGWLSQLLGFVLPADLAGLNQDVIVAALTALVQILFPVQAAMGRARLAKGLKA
jgi:hypothetical protein